MNKQKYVDEIGVEIQNIHTRKSCSSGQFHQPLVTNRKCTRDNCLTQKMSFSLAIKTVPNFFILCMNTQLEVAQLYFMICQNPKTLS